MDEIKDINKKELYGSSFLFCYNQYMSEINVYCDETCHLEKDDSSFMVLGAISIKKDKIIEVRDRINEIKIDNGYSKDFEIKWTKVSNSGFTFYKQIVDYFFDDDDITFRALLVDKRNLDNSKHNQTFDEFYYKMYFYLLHPLLDNGNQFNIYLDIKDTNGGKKVKKTKEVLSNKMYDFDEKIIKKIQQIRSDESTLLQVADLLIGALQYNKNNESQTNIGKVKLLERISDRFKFNLDKSTLINEKKFNLFYIELKK